MKTKSIVVRTVVTALAVLSLTSGAAMQSGGGFEITEAVVAAGGGSASAGNVEVDSTLGQPAADGAMGGGIFGLTSGFWSYTALAPTAAQASISGRVVDRNGAPVNNAVLYLQTQDGLFFISRSSPFGYYMFEEITIGQSVFITVQHKRFTFEPRSVMVADNVTEFDFVAQ